MKTKDEICNFCKIAANCKTKDVCAPLDWIDGNKSRKEPLIRDLSQSTGDFEYSDYNTVLAELIEDKKYKTETGIEKIKQILLIQDYRTRGIGAMLLFNIPRVDIARILHITEGRLSQLYPVSRV